MLAVPWCLSEPLELHEPDYGRHAGQTCSVSRPPMAPPLSPVSPLLAPSQWAPASPSPALLSPGVQVRLPRRLEVPGGYASSPGGPCYWTNAAKGPASAAGSGWLQVPTAAGFAAGPITPEPREREKVLRAVWGRTGEPQAPRKPESPLLWQQQGVKKTEEVPETAVPLVVRPGGAYSLTWSLASPQTPGTHETATAGCSSAAAAAPWTDGSLSPLAPRHLF